MNRERRKELVAKAKFLAGMWLDADLDGADCWDSYTDEEADLIIATVRKLAARLKRY